MSCMASHLPNANGSPQGEPKLLEPTDILQSVEPMSHAEQIHYQLAHQHLDLVPEIVAWSSRTQE